MPHALKSAWLHRDVCINCFIRLKLLQDVIETLREKFRSDMRMLSQPVYSLYVTYPNGNYHKLDGHECPLMVQLNWAVDNSDGRFLVQNEGRG